MSGKRTENPGQRFKREMKEMGLGVTFIVPGRDPVVVTSWDCPDCQANRKDAVKPCPECGSEKDAVLT